MSFYSLKGKKPLNCCLSCRLQFPDCELHTRCSHTVHRCQEQKAFPRCSCVHGWGSSGEELRVKETMQQPHCRVDGESSTQNNQQMFAYKKRGTLYKWVRKILRNSNCICKTTSTLFYICSLAFGQFVEYSELQHSIIF